MFGPVRVEPKSLGTIRVTSGLKEGAHAAINDRPTSIVDTQKRSEWVEFFGI